MLRNAKWRRNAVERKTETVRHQKRVERIVKANKLLTQRRMFDTSELTCSINESEAVTNDEQEAKVVQSDEHVRCEEPQDKTTAEKIAEQLRAWVNNNRISQTAVHQLLQIFCPYFPELPRHQRTLLRTAIDIKLDNVAGGDYSYLTLKRVLPNVLKKAKLTVGNLQQCNNKLRIQFNVDGLPVFNSVNYSVWPILGSVVYPIKSDVFTVAVYGSTSKPNAFNAYLQPLVDEIKEIADGGGLLLPDLKARVQIEIENFCCDAPAKADLRLVKQFNARQGCERCNVDGPVVPIASDGDWDLATALVVSEDALPLAKRPFSNYLSRRIIASVRNAKAPVKAAIRSILESCWASSRMSMLGW